MQFLRKVHKIPRKFAIIAISVYQKTLSPDHGWLKHCFPQGYCRFYPTCSEYSKQAFEKYGFFKGFFLANWRILRCNPWSKGGIDELK
ncbi:MAG TPA: membrane protein insertion efficiency factor YidD [Patescibacteria group bacterium]|nr:membrane protein insertion efficiency factor YidD [Patescibacteria group bacterium]